MVGRLTGGCQCGAVRFSVETVHSASICHCRMCQKATGAPFGAFANVDPATTTWTRGARRLFRSSTVAERGFCADCGTPLTWEAAGDLAITIAAFDDAATIVPTAQLSHEMRLHWADNIAAMPVRDDSANPVIEAFMASVVTLQHPDNDTAEWPKEP